MPLNLLKLCVGVDTIGELDEWIAWRLDDLATRGLPREHVHTTRMVPKRTDELAGGSLYWVIKGQISARQELLGIRPFTDGEGIGRCHLVLDSKLVPVEPRPFRPFQGWRYLRPEDAPPDLSPGMAGDLASMPENLRRELATLGLL